MSTELYDDNDFELPEDNSLTKSKNKLPEEQASESISYAADFESSVKEPSVISYANDFESSVGGSHVISAKSEPNNNNLDKLDAKDSLSYAADFESSLDTNQKPPQLSTKDSVIEPKDSFISYGDDFESNSPSYPAPENKEPSDKYSTNESNNYNEDFSSIEQHAQPANTNISIGKSFESNATEHLENSLPRVSFIQTEPDVSDPISSKSNLTDPNFHNSLLNEPNEVFSLLTQSKTEPQILNQFIDPDEISSQEIKNIKSNQRSDNEEEEYADDFAPMISTMSFNAVNNAVSSALTSAISHVQQQYSTPNSPSHPSNTNFIAGDNEDDYNIEEDEEPSNILPAMKKVDPVEIYRKEGMGRGLSEYLGIQRIDSNDTNMSEIEAEMHEPEKASFYLINKVIDDTLKTPLAQNLLHRDSSNNKPEASHNEELPLSTETPSDDNKCTQEKVIIETPIEHEPSQLTDENPYSEDFSSAPPTLKEEKSEITNTNNLEDEYEQMKDELPPKPAQETVESKEDQGNDYEWEQDYEDLVENDDNPKPTADSNHKEDPINKPQESNTPYYNDFEDNDFEPEVTKTNIVTSSNPTDTKPSEETVEKTEKKISLDSLQRYIEPVRPKSQPAGVNSWKNSNVPSSKVNQIRGIVQTSRTKSANDRPNNTALPPKYPSIKPSSASAAIPTSKPTKTRPASADVFLTSVPLNGEKKTEHRHSLPLKQTLLKPNNPIRFHSKEEKLILQDVCFHRKQFTACKDKYCQQIYDKYQYIPIIREKSQEALELLMKADEIWNEKIEASYEQSLQILKRQQRRELKQYQQIIRQENPLLTKNLINSYTLMKDMSLDDEFNDQKNYESTGLTHHHYDFVAKQLQVHNQHIQYREKTLLDQKKFDYKQEVKDLQETLEIPKRFLVQMKKDHEHNITFHRDKMERTLWEFLKLMVAFQMSSSSGNMNTAAVLQAMQKRIEKQANSVMDIVKTGLYVIAKVCKEIQRVYCHAEEEIADLIAGGKYLSRPVSPSSRRIQSRERLQKSLHKNRDGSNSRSPSPSPSPPVQSPSFDPKALCPWDDYVDERPRTAPSANYFVPDGFEDAFNPVDEDEIIGQHQSYYTEDFNAVSNNNSQYQEDGSVVEDINYHFPTAKPTNLKKQISNLTAASSIPEDDGIDQLRRNSNTETASYSEDFINSNSLTGPEQSSSLQLAEGTIITQDVDDEAAGVLATKSEEYEDDNEEYEEDYEEINHNKSSYDENDPNIHEGDVQNKPKKNKKLKKKRKKRLSMNPLVDNYLHLAKEAQEIANMKDSKKNTQILLTRVLAVSQIPSPKLSSKPSSAPLSKALSASSMNSHGRPASHSSSRSPSPSRPIQRKEDYYDSDFQPVGLDEFMMATSSPKSTMKLPEPEEVHRCYYCKHKFMGLGKVLPENIKQKDKDVKDRIWNTLSNVPKRNLPNYNKKVKLDEYQFPHLYNDFVSKVHDSSERSQHSRMFCTWKCLKRWTLQCCPMQFKYQNELLIDIAAGFQVSID